MEYLYISKQNTVSLGISEGFWDPQLLAFPFLFTKITPNQTNKKHKVTHRVTAHTPITPSQIQNQKGDFLVLHKEL